MDKINSLLIESFGIPIFEEIITPHNMTHFTMEESIQVKKKY